MEPKPQVVAQRTVECRVLTPAGWVLGRLRSPLNTPLLDYLNQREPFLRLTDVSIPPRHDRHDFFAVGLESAVAWIPQETAAVEEMTAGLGTVAHATSWLLPGGVVLDGHLDLDPGERVSDHLLHRKGFVVLKDVTLILPHGGPFLPGAFTYEVLALQSARAVGVTELPTQP